MADILVSIGPSNGLIPPPPYGADNYKIFGKYRGGWDDTLTKEINGLSHVFTGRPGGEHQFFAKAMFEFEVSQGYETATIVVAGTLAAVPSGTPMPDGNPDIAPPTGCEATLNA